MKNTKIQNCFFIVVVIGICGCVVLWCFLSSVLPLFFRRCFLLSRVLTSFLTLLGKLLSFCFFSVAFWSFVAALLPSRVCGRLGVPPPFPLWRVRGKKIVGSLQAAPD